MNDLIGKAHAYLDDKGCKSIGQKYTAFEIEKMLADFAQQQLNLLNIPVVIESVCETCRNGFWLRKNTKCTECGRVKLKDD